jgi:hypothetical protein
VLQFFSAREAQKEIATSDCASYNPGYVAVAIKQQIFFRGAAMRILAFTGATIATAFLTTASAAVAQETRCGGGYTVRAGQHSQASISTRAGTPCKMTYVTFGTSRASSGIQITAAPRNGRASADGSGFRYAPKAGFHGTDTMTVRFHWNGPPSNKPATGLVTFAIAVD